VGEALGNGAVDSEADGEGGVEGEGLEEGGPQSTVDSQPS